MSETSLELARSIDAVFSCDDPIVHLYFVMNGEQVGRNFAFSRSEATTLGKQIADAGEWESFQLTMSPLKVSEILVKGCTNTG
jgi:hypothetical protein